MALERRQLKQLQVLAENGAPASIVDEMQRRLESLAEVNHKMEQKGTTAPQFFSGMNSFVANPSTVSPEAFARMKDTDETVGSGLDFLNLALIARFGEFKHANPKIEGFIRRALAMMEGSWHENLDEMFSAEWAGFSVTEIVWRFEKDFDGFAAWVPKKLVTYHPLTVVFAVDPSGSVLPNGIYQYQRFYGGNQFYQMGDLDDGFRPDLFAARGDFAHPIRMGGQLTYNAIQIDRSKCIHLRSSTTGKFGNPYGRSILRRIYKSWIAKDAMLKLWIIAADRRASPLIVGYAAPNDTVHGQDEYGNTITGVRSDVAMANALRNIHNESALVFPGKKDEAYSLESIQTQSDLTVFKDHIEYANRAIMRGLLIPPLILGGDGGGSYALGDAHRQIFQQVVDGKLKSFKQAIIEQFIKQIIEMNFPKEEYHLHGYGDFVVEEFDPEVMERLSNIYNTLTTAGYMSPSEQKDMDMVCEKFKLPPRKAVSMDRVQNVDDDTGGLNF